MSEELGLQLPEDDDAELLTDAFIMCISYGIFGLIPISLFCLVPMGMASPHSLYIMAVCISLVIMCVLAIVKSSFSSATSLHAALEAICLGTVASVLAYLIGAGVTGVLGL